MQRSTRFIAAVALCAWALAVFVAGTDMLSVWIEQLRGAGEPGDIETTVWLRLGLLAIAAIAPPCLLWAIWRIGARMAHALAIAAAAREAAPASPLSVRVARRVR